jgi:hypothetical protein
MTITTRAAVLRHSGAARPYADSRPLTIETVTLDPRFFRALMEHGMPVRELAIRQLSNQSVAIDIYVWLAYRLSYLKKEEFVSWKSLYGQFGHSYDELRFFRREFVRPLEHALAVYPGAKVEKMKEGLMLHPSPSPVDEKDGSARIHASSRPRRSLPSPKVIDIKPVEIKTGRERLEHLEREFFGLSYRKGLAPETKREIGRMYRNRPQEDADALEAALEEARSLVEAAVAVPA